MKLTILMPCLNESQSLPFCIRRAKEFIDRHNIEAEILISDNGSTDGSQVISEKLGARVVHCPIRGYGAALQYGIQQAKGDYILMGDSDDSYHFDEVHSMIMKLDDGFDVCMGTRLKGLIMPGAMPLLNRYIGNPILTYIGKLFFNIDTSDFHCGIRAFRREKIEEIGLVTTGMEWASEMVIKSKLNGLKMTEVPITLYKDARNRPPHLRRWRDGWRHLRFMLLHAPIWLFTYPGLALVFFASIVGLSLLSGPIRVGVAKLDVHTLLAMSFMLISGIQMIFTGLFASIYSHSVGILPTTTQYIKRLQELSLEKLLIAASVIGFIGLLILFYTFYGWYSIGFSSLEYQATMRCLIPALTLITIAGQFVFNGFMLSVLFLKTSPYVYNNLHDKLD